jgi:hypothetical protein
MEPEYFTPEQMQVWQTLRALNDCWTKGDGSRLAEYFHKDMVAITPSDRLRRVGRDECIAGWSAFAASAVIHSWKELEPLIRMFDRTAVVTYYYEMSCEIAGRTLTLTGRDMFVFLKENGRWWAVADQFSNYPG